MKLCIGTARGEMQIIEPLVRLRLSASAARLLMGGVLCLIGWISFSSAAAGQQISVPEPQAGTIIGTVIDVNGGVVPETAVLLQGSSPDDDPHAVANDSGFFQFEHVKPGVPYRVTVSASGFTTWTSPEITLEPGQYLELTGIRLNIAEAVTTVYATLSTQEIATEQVRVEEHQRVLGFIPNFYVTYDRHPVPLTRKLKFQLALRATTDPVTFLGSAFVAGMDQAADKFDFQQGARGYFQRFGPSYANGFTDIVVGGAILPSILHQDPRYFYQGTARNISAEVEQMTKRYGLSGEKVTTVQAILEEQARKADDVAKNDSVNLEEKAHRMFSSNS